MMRKASISILCFDDMPWLEWVTGVDSPVTALKISNRNLVGVCRRRLIPAPICALVPSVRSLSRSQILVTAAKFGQFLDRLIIVFRTRQCFISGLNKVL